MPVCNLKIIDQVNVKFENLDPHTRKIICDTLKFMIPSARHTPKYKLGRWDGKVGFATVGGGTYINLLDRILDIVTNAGYDINLIDQRPEYNFHFPEITEYSLSQYNWPIGHELAGQPIMLRDYQAASINLYLNNLQSIQVISTGGGKTIITALLCKLCEPYGRTITIVPSKSLVMQTEEDYKTIELDVGVYYGDRKDWNKQHTICTWQSLVALEKKDTDEEVSLDEFMKDVVSIIVDEAHTIKGKELKSLLCTSPCSNVPIRWALTGTIPPEEFEFVSLLSSIGPVVGGIRADTLQKEGILANCQIETLQLNDKHVEFKNWHDEINYISTDKIRLEWVSNFIAKLAETGNTLVLVSSRELGKQLNKALPGSAYVNGSVTALKRKKEYKKIQQAENEILIGTYGVASTGINIPRIFNLVLIEPGKSFIRSIQSIGRSIRRAHDKDFALITEITSTLTYSKRHLSKRKVFYKEAGYPHIVKKVNYR